MAALDHRTTRVQADAMSMVRYTIVLQRPMASDDTPSHRGNGVQAAQLLADDLRRLLATDAARRVIGDGVELVVSARRFVGLHTLPLSELAPDDDLNRHNYEDNPEVIP